MLCIYSWCECINQWAWLSNLLILQFAHCKRQHKPSFFVFHHPIWSTYNLNLLSFWGRLKPNNFHRRWRKRVWGQPFGYLIIPSQKGGMYLACRYSDQSHAHHFLIFPLSSFGLMLKKQIHNVIATCLAKPDSLTPILSTPPLAQPRRKACRNCAGLAVTGATGSPTGRGTVGTGCGTACGSGCRTYLCRCPRVMWSQPGRKVGCSTGLSWCLPKWLDKKGTTCSPQLSEVTKTGPKILHTFYEQFGTCLFEFRYLIFGVSIISISSQLN